MQSIFIELVRFINSKSLNTVITRKEINEHLKRAMRYGYTPASTIDNYRLMLCHTGYLQSTCKRGEYIVKKRIHETLTSTKLYKLAYPDPLK